MPNHHAQPHRDDQQQQQQQQQQPIAAEHQQRLQEILEELQTLGFCLPGSVAERQIRCPNEGCHCHQHPPQLHGPYLAWTRKVNQKTVTHNLTPGQATRYRAWFQNNRRLRQLTSELQALSLKAAAEAEKWGEK
ncbi:MAG: DUF6788 family protein [Solirubrobacteraceae bacterium]